MNDTHILHDFGDGLILRRGQLADMKEIVEFNSGIHSDAGPDEPELPVGYWTQDLFTNHPTTSPQDFTVVEDTKSGKIVSTLCLISQTWTYGGIPFPVGRPELVGTDPEYRNRGLIRKQFKVIHQWSAERGEILQAITGIPYYYRLFGYEMGLEFSGGRIGYLPLVPKLKDDETEPFTFRKAGTADIPFLKQLHEDSHQRYLVNCQRDDDLWDFEISGIHTESVNRLDFFIIENTDSHPVGFIACSFLLWGPTLAIQRYELVDGVSWFDVTPSVIRFTQTRGEELAALDEKKTFQAYAFYFGSEHPAYHVYQDKFPRIRDPYAYYIRIPDMPAFLRLITPVLEDRLANSVMVGHSGELKISFYSDGIKMTFENGKITGIDSEVFKQNASDAYFPNLTFIQALMGYRSIDEIHIGYRDCAASTDLGRAIMPILFPKMPSAVWPLS